MIFRPYCGYTEYKNLVTFIPIFNAYLQEMVDTLMEEMDEVRLCPFLFHPLIQHAAVLSIAKFLHADNNCL